ncbi:DNA primase TraC [Dyadobacter sp. CECT 9275]|uniref:DNA primase TraC n=1 Tax=Dyadobacter helix TaxID=2822344 RepID=A0A916N6T7_9BACT|nr:zincin-like metallopeptidase domain-containing protein [Dyadobacter sp. CECT 9275]CAG5011189.1 DNA primase TraC [Dyadobacter sp. CECT 9275]
MKSSKPKKKTSRNQNQEDDLKIDTQPQTDIYSRVTNKILADLEKGNLTWRQPWSSGYLSTNVTLPLRWNDQPYSGINTILLWAAACEKNYTLSHWMTFKQALELKGSVIKGEKGTQIVYADHMIKEEESQDGQSETRKIPFLKTYTVFNVSQIKDLPAHYYNIPERKELNLAQRNQELETFFANTKADIYTGTNASYNQTTDRIQMPPFESFESAEGFYSTLGHEICHWTKHPTRLDRDFGRKHFGDQGYAKEELVAEIGSCYLSAILGIEPIPQEQHAAYIQHWLKALQDDKRLIFSAASHAQKAAEFVLAHST